MTEATGIRPSSYTQADADELVRQFEALDRENFFKEFGYYPGTLVRDPISLKAHKFLTDQGAATLVYQGCNLDSGPNAVDYPDYDRYHSEGQDIVIDWRGRFFSIRKVTPLVAEELLTTSSSNRPVNLSQVSKLTEEFLGGPYSRIDHWSKRWPRCECWLCRSADGDPDAGTED